MSETERNEFEKNLQKVPFAEDALEGLSSLSSDELLTDLKELNSRISTKSKPANRIFLYRIAASIAIILTVSSLFYLILNRKIDLENGPVVLSESVQKPIVEKDLLQAKKDVPNTKEIASGNGFTQKKFSAKPSESESKESSAIQNVSVETAPPQMSPKPPVPEIISRQDVGEGAIVFAEKEETSYARMGEKVATAPAGAAQIADVQKIRGKIVSSEDNQPIPGVSVLIKGTSMGAISDNEGAFEIPVGSNQDTTPTLEISFIGMEQQEVLANGSNELKIVLNPSLYSLNEIVVSGYGSRRKADRSAKVTSDVLEIPEPVCGQKAFKKYISENQIFPENNLNIYTAKVILEFSVNQDSIPYNIKVIESPADAFSKESIRLLENGPRWNPVINASSPTRLTIILEKEKK
jgi:hypothetical protein